ncbi:MAG: O-antigen ligase family protein [Gammaproteobacteria bacterium]|nr:O-antigen ligase family protein [Gammaproteobacteria bacterium]
MATGRWLLPARYTNRSLARDLGMLVPWLESPVGYGSVLGVLAILAGIGTVATIVLVLNTPKFIALSVIGMLGAASYMLSGNRRLFVLYGFVLLAPLKLGLNFVVIGHQGGAQSFVIHATDFLLIMLAIYQYYDWRRKRVPDYRMPLVGKLWLGMMLLGLVSVFTSEFQTPAAHEVVRMGKNLVILLLLVNELRRKKQFQHLALALMLGVMVQSAFSIVSYSAGSQLGLEFLGEETEKNVIELGEATLKGDAQIRRPGGLMGHPNQFAGYLALVMPIGIALMFSPISTVTKALFIVALGLGQIGLLLTLSRSGWICFAVALMFTLGLSFLHRSSRRRYFIARMSIIALVGMVGLAASPRILERIQYSDPESWRSRMEMIDIAWKIVRDKPLFGLGLNSYVFAQPPYTRFRTYAGMEEFYGENVPVVHSTWMLTWAEQGTLGMALFVFIHLVVLYVGFNNLKLKDGFLHATNVGALSGFIALMLDGLVSFFLRMDAGGRMFWLSLSIILAIGYWRRTYETGAALSAPSRVISDGRDRAARNWLVPQRTGGGGARGWLGR